MGHFLATKKSQNCNKCFGEIELYNLSQNKAMFIGMIRFLLASMTDLVD